MERWASGAKNMYGKVFCNIAVILTKLVGFAGLDFNN
jgi:hypothetical protein